MSDPFYEGLLIAPEQEAVALRTIAGDYMVEADRKVAIDAKLAVVLRKAEDRKNMLWLRFREEKEAGNKSLTEGAIAAAISVDQIYKSLTEQADTLKLASQRQGHRLEAVRMKAAALKTLTENLNAERRLAGRE